MGLPKKKDNELGKSLLRRTGHGKNRIVSSRHTTAAEAEAEGATGTAISITENTSIDEFLSNAQAAQRNFEAERGSAAIANLGVVDEDDYSSEGSDVSDEDGEEAEFFTIPKKPQWTQSMAPEEYRQLETDTFLKWKRQLNKMQNKHPNLPPFEKNLEFWRQLWKIVEISDIVVQVVDARDPMFYASHDLATYVSEVAGGKTSVFLLNKADYLTAEQRQIWAEFFKRSDMKTLFFSATDINDRLAVGHSKIVTGSQQQEDMIEFNTSAIMEPPAVLAALKSLSPTPDSGVTVGFVGYPNVGKSSTINRFLENRRLQVSATPGKTKHYQTHVLSGGRVTLVDGPGLVIPSLHMTKAEMVLSGILPIDNLTDPMPCINQLLSTRTPFAQVVSHYGIMQSCLSQGFRDSAKYANRESQQVLSALGLMRGFMKPGGVPDESRAARVILKDLVTGKLLFTKAPPDVDQLVFDGPDKAKLLEKKDVFDEEDDVTLEETFPELRVQSGVHVRGAKALKKGGNTMAQDKKAQRGNKKKRDKARRLYAESSY